MELLTIVGCIVVGGICYYLATQAEKMAQHLHKEAERLMQENERLEKLRDDLQDEIVHVRGKRWP